jgi:alpha-L-fucosidase 2
MTGRLTRRACLVTVPLGLSAGHGALRARPAPPPPSPPRSAHRLWYRQPAPTWVEALPTGNGRLGAMVFGGTGEERLQLNEDTLWSGGPYVPDLSEAGAALPMVRELIAQGHYAQAEALANARLMARPLHQMSYQTFGDLRLSMPLDGPVTAYRRDLDLDQAVATTRFRHGDTVCQRQTLVSPVDQVIATRITASRPLSLRIALDTPHSATIETQGAELLLTGHNGAEEGIAGALTMAARLRVQAQGGVVRAVDGHLTVEGARAVTILIALATSHRGFADTGSDPLALTAQAIEQAARRPFALLKRRATAEHQRLYHTASLDLGQAPAADLSAADLPTDDLPTPDLPTDERILANQTRDEPGLAALYFHYARYLLICSSRPGTQPANLQGIWNESNTPPWGSKYTININTEMNYWPADPAGLAECTEPLLALVRDLARTGAHTARVMYGARGWVAHHNTDLWRATGPIDGAPWGLWPTGGAWLCTMLWDRWDYGRDRAYLRAIYPLLQGAAQFFLDTLQTDPASGALITSPSISPENRHPMGASVCAGPAMDRQILRDLFERTAHAARELGQDPAFAAQCQDARGRLAPDRIGAQGQLQEWLADWDAAAPEPHHRHVSHLYALYPSHQIAPGRTPALAAAARRSLDLRGDESTGWATAWRIALWARLGDGERAHRILRFLLGPGRTYPNLFDAHPPFQIDGNFGGAASMIEMLVQSWQDEIHLLPALPAAWPRGQARGIMARAATRVDLAWRGGVLDHVVLSSPIAGPRRLRLGGVEQVVDLQPGRSLRLTGARLQPG